MATTLEYAKLSQNVYESVTPIDQWTVLQEAPRELQQSGFYGAAYQKVEIGEIVIAYRGTEPNIQAIWDDLDADIQIGSGDEHQQFVDALKFAKDIQDTYQGIGYDISVTGHSLGGGLAQLAANTFGWDGVTFEAPGMGAYSPPSDGGMIESFLQANHLSTGNVGDLVNLTVLGSSLSSWAGDFIGTKHDLITEQGRPDLLGLSIEAGIAPGAVIAFFGGVVPNGFDQGGRHRIENFIAHLEQAEQEGVLLQQYVDSYLVFGAEDYTAPERTLTQTLRGYFNDVFNPDHALSQGQAEDLIGQLATLRDSEVYADATDNQIADLEKAQDKLRRATQKIVSVSADKDSWHETAQHGNILTINVELKKALDRETQRINLDMPSMDAVTGKGKHFDVVSSNFHVDYGTSSGSLNFPDGYCLEVQPGEKTATLALRANPDIDDQDEALGDLTLSLPGRSGPRTSQTLSDLTIHDDPASDFSQSVGNGRTIQGDYVWLDKDPGTPGIQFVEDDLGNRLYQNPLQKNVGQADLLYDSAGNDHILPGGGNDDVNAYRGGNDHIEGAGGRDRIEADAGSDLIEGGAGGDLATGGGQADRIFGGRRTGLSEAIAAGNTESNGTRRGEFLAGNGGDDLLVSGNQRDAITGGDGNDVIVSGAGNDAVDADADYSPAGRDWSVDTSGGSLTFSPVFPYAGNLFGHDVIYLGKGKDIAHGGPGQDTIKGERGGDTILGEAGEDSLIGGRGSDSLGGDNGPSVVDPPAHGTDFIDGGRGEDKLVGHGGSDRLYGGDGQDYLTGGAEGLDPLYEGEDYLDGGSNNDDLYGSEGGDVLYGRSGEDDLFGGGPNIDPADDGEDNLYGGSQADDLFGGAAGDTLFGGDGKDDLVGDSAGTKADYQGADVLRGGVKKDNLFGGGQGGPSCG